VNVVDRVQKAWARIVRDWERGIRLAHEARVAGDTALFAIDTDTPEGDIQASAQRAGFALQIKLLEQRRQEHPLSFSDEMQLRQLRRVVRRIDEAEAIRHPTPENMGPQRMAQFGPIGQPRGFLSSLPLPPWAGILTSPAFWMVLLFSIPAAFGAVQSMRLGHTEHQRDVAIEQANANATAAAQWEARAHAYEQATADAQAAARTTAATLEAERARVARARRREQERTRAIQEVIAHGDAPAWSLHDAPADASPPRAPDGAPIGGGR